MVKKKKLFLVQQQNILLSPRSFKTGCRCILKASVNRKKDMFVVFEFKEEHRGHEVNRDMYYLHYPEVDINVPSHNMTYSSESVNIFTFLTLCVGAFHPVNVPR